MSQASQQRSWTETNALVPPARMLPGLHGLRGAAACVVLIYHLILHADLPLPPVLQPLASHGGLSVHLFFVLSAFSLAHCHFKEPIDTGAYLTKRFFRIAPLFYAVLIYIVMQRLLYGGDTSIAMLLANLTFTFNLIPDTDFSLAPGGWSIGVEMVFYVLLPIVLFSFRRLFPLILFAVAVNVASWSVSRSFSALPEQMQSAAYFGVAPNLGIFASGLVAYWIFRDLPASISRGYAIAIGAAIVSLLIVLVSPWILPSTNPARPAVRLLWGILFAAVVLWQARAPLRVLSCAAMQYLGERSYSIYLLHLLVIDLCTPIYETLALRFADLGSWVFLLGLVATLLVLLPAAELTYRFIEIPGIRFGRRLLARRVARSR